MARTQSLQVKSELTALQVALQWFHRTHLPQIPREVWLQCQIGLAEGLTNAIRHAHRDRSPETPILIEFLVEERTLELRIWDEGPEFDLQKKLSSIPAVVDSEQVGGRGLRLIQRIADDFSYRRSPDHRNCLTIVKHFEPKKTHESYFR